MNIQEYIDSGLLEVYAAGGLSANEQAEVEAMALQHPEVNFALDQAIRAMEAYALTHAQPPRPNLENEIINRILEAPGFASPEQPRSAPKLRLGGKAKRNQRWQWAVVLLLVVSAFTNYSLYNRLQEKEEQLLAARQESRKITYQVSQLEQKSFQTESILSVLRDPQTTRVALKGVGGIEGVLATVFWNVNSKEVYLDPAQLPRAPAGKQYQLWGLHKGQPISAGLVSQFNSLQRMKTMAAAQAFAITLEPAGGSAAPSLEAMVVMGTI